VFHIFLHKAKSTRIPSPVSGTDNSLQKLPDSSATSCFIAFFSKLLEYIIDRAGMQEFLQKNFAEKRRFFDELSDNFNVSKDRLPYTHRGVQ
jgi:hypothetical protein